MRAIVISGFFRLWTVEVLGYTCEGFEVEVPGLGGRLFQPDELEFCLPESKSLPTCPYCSKQALVFNGWKDELFCVNCLQLSAPFGFIQREIERIGFVERSANK